MNTHQTYSPIVGSISLWQYVENERNYPGWNLSVDTLGATSLLSVLAELQAADGFRTISITLPTPSTLSVPNNQAKWTAPTKWRLNYLSANEDVDEWSFPPGQQIATLSLGKNCLLQLQAGIVSAAHGRGDYSIGGSEQASEHLWCWWRHD